MRQSKYSVSLKFSFSLMFGLSLHFVIFLKQDFSPQSSMFRWHVYLVHRKGNQVENYVYSHGLVLRMVHDSFTFRIENIFVIFLPRKGVSVENIHIEINVLSQKVYLPPRKFVNKKKRINWSSPINWKNNDVWLNWIWHSFLFTSRQFCNCSFEYQLFFS